MSSDTGLFVVADGAGGRASGQVAAKLACDTVTKTLQPRLAGAGLADVRVAIDSALRTAHEQIEKKQTDPQFAGMATTVVVMVAQGQKLHVAHVGDSRAYLVRDGKISRLTRDHSLKNYLADNPQIQPKVKRPGSTLVRALGMKTAGAAEVEHSTHDIKSGDVILACTDGVSGVLPRWTLQAMLNCAAEVGEDALAQQLIRAALAHGTMDNATAVVVRAIGPNSGRRTLGWLAFLEGVRQGEVLQVGRAVDIGTAPDCTVQIAEGAARNTRIELGPGGYTIRNLDPAGKTFINDVRVESETIVDGDVVRIGNTRIVFKAHRFS